MRIAILTSEFPVLSETFIIDHVTSLLDRGHDVTVFAFKSDPSSCPHAIVKDRSLESLVRLIEPSYAGNNFIRLVFRAVTLLRDGWREPIITLRSLNPFIFGRSALFLSTFACSRGFAQFRKFDIVHCHFSWSGIVGAKLRKIKAIDAKLVVTFHGADVNASWGIGSSRDRRIMFETADWFTANSNFTKERAVELGCPPDRCSIWRMGVDMRMFKFKERAIGENEPLKLLTVGRLVEKKGIEYAIRALAEVGNNCRNVEYHVVGDGPLRTDLEDLANSVCPNNKVIFHGNCSSNEVRKQFDSAHLFILPCVTAANGDREGQSVALVEAQACGLPILSTNHAAISETVVHNKSGFLVPERDVCALADRLQYLIVHAETWKEMGRFGRAHVEAKFSSEHCTDVIVSVYEQLMMLRD